MAWARDRAAAAGQISAAEREYWIEQGRLGAAAPLRLTRIDSSVPAETAAARIDRVDRDTTLALLTAVPRAYRTHLADALLTALVCASGSRSLGMLVEGHGRLGQSAVDPTICGWLTALYPLHVAIEDCDDIGRCLKAIKEQARAVPREGIGWGLLREHAADPESAPIRSLPEPSFRLNVLGERPRGWQVAAAADDPVEPGLSLTVEVVDHELELRWVWPEGEYDEADVIDFASRVRNQLAKLAAHAATGVFGYTPSDFPLARLDAAPLDALVGAIPHVRDLYPLAALQEGMLFRSLYEPDSDAYVVCMAMELVGDVDLVRLRRAWELVVERHEVLRTVFLWQGHRPFQAVLGETALEWIEDDWRETPSDRQGADLDHLIARERRRPFAWTERPPVRVRAVRLATDRVVVLFVHSHIVLDGWSLPIVLDELAAAYAGERPGAPPIRYRDFIQWLGCRRDAAPDRFWQQELAGVEPTLLLDGGLERSAAASQLRRLERDVPASVPDAAEHAGVTISVLMQAAWAVLLSRHVGREDVLYGLTVAGRPVDLPGVDRVVGLFINTVPVRVTVSPEVELQSFLMRLQGKIGHINDSPHVSLARLQALSPTGAGRPLFDTLFVFENYPVRDVAPPPGATWRYGDVRTEERTEYPITVTVMPRRHLRFEIAYQLCDEGWAAQVAAQYTHLLGSMAAALLREVRP
jgi:non-ribosomal peptide synthase protein (TIGR01720 family)